MLGTRLSDARVRAACWIAPLAVIAIGLGFYMLHNTLQTNATQMTPRGARHRGRDFFGRALFRADPRRRGLRALRPLQRGADLHGAALLARAGTVVRACAEAATGGGL